MKKILILILALIVVFGAFAVYAEGKISASAERPEFWLETFYGDPSAAEGLEIKDCVFMLQDEQYNNGGKYYTWKVDMKISGGTVGITSMSSERDAVYKDLAVMMPWPDDMVDRDIVARQSPQIADLNGKYVYKAYPKDGYYCLDVTDAATGTVLHSVTVCECATGVFEYPKLFAGRGSVVVALVQDYSARDPVYGWVVANDFVCCVTADGEMINIPARQFTFKGETFFVARGTGFISATSKGGKFAVVQRDYEHAIRNDAGEVIGIDFMPCSQAVWVFGPSGLEFMGLIRCSLEGVVQTVVSSDGSYDYTRWPIPYHKGYEIYTKVFW